MKRASNSIFSCLYPLLVTVLISGCNLEQNINLDLPEHESKLVVESYLEPGKPVHLLLTESSPYLAPPSPPFVIDALVTVTYKNITDTLMLNPEIDGKDGKIYNYISNRTVPEDYENEFTLYIKDAKGRIVTGKTKLIRPVLLDTVEFRFKKDSSAFALISFYDDPSIDNYYRILVHKDSLSNVVQKFEFTDELAETSKISIGTRYAFTKENEAFVTLFHLDKAYYDYLSSVEAAKDANFNPFAQPSGIISNVKGGLGIFTSLAFDHKIVRVDDQQ